MADVNDLVATRGDPLAFARLAAKPEAWQAEVLEDLRLRSGEKFIGQAVAAGHGVGCTTLLAWLAIWNLLTSENSRSVLTSATESQVITKLWPEVRRWWNFLVDRGGVVPSDGFEIQDGAIVRSDAKELWRIDCIPLRGPEALAGIGVSGRQLFVGFDCASLITRRDWTVMSAAFDGAHRGMWAACSVPHNRDCCFGEKFAEPGWSAWHVDARNYPNRVRPEVIKRWEEDFGADSDFFRTRVAGQFL